MDGNRLAGVKGWLLVYLIGSIPLLMVYSIAFSGSFFEYPVVLMAAIFLVLALPLGLILLKSPKAPQWNIAELWLLAVLMTLRSISVFLMPVSGEEMSRITSGETGGWVDPHAYCVVPKQSLPTMEPRSSSLSLSLIHI